MGSGGIIGILSIFIVLALLGAFEIWARRRSVPPPGDQRPTDKAGD